MTDTSNIFNMVISKQGVLVTAELEGQHFHKTPAAGDRGWQQPLVCDTGQKLNMPL